MRPLTIAVFGDIHVGFDEVSNHNAAAAFADVRAVSPDLLILLGDVVDRDARHWGQFLELLDGVGLPWTICRGNADFDAGADPAWDEYIGRPPRHVLDLSDVRFIVIGATDGNHELGVGVGAGAWLRDQAAERPDALAIGICHAPVKDTTFWSCSNTEDKCLAELLEPENPPYHLYVREYRELDAALRTAPTVRVLLTGHVHSDHRLVCSHGYRPVEERDGVLHIATANIGGWQGFGVPRREYRVLEVWEQELRVRVRDFIGASWVDWLEARFPLKPPGV